MHEQSQDRVVEHSPDLGNILTVQAKLIAFQQGDIEVLPRHVEEAYDSLRRTKERTRSREFAIALGGVFLGAFIPGFITEFADQPSAWLVSIYVVLGFVGITMLLWGLLSER